MCVGGGVLPQLNIPGFVDSPSEVLPFLGSGEEGGREGGGGELWSVCKMNKKIKKT